METPQSPPYTPHREDCSCIGKLTRKDPFTLLFMRHAKPEGVYYGDVMPYEEFIRTITAETSKSIPLSPVGQEDALASFARQRIEEQPIEAIISSDYLRSEQTALLAQDYIRQTTGKLIPLVIEPLLGEVALDHTVWTPERYTSTIETRGINGVINDLTTTWETGGSTTETREQTYTRGKALLHHMSHHEPAQPKGKPLMVSHGWLGNVLLAIARGERAEDHNRAYPLLGYSALHEIVIKKTHGSW